MNYAATMNCVYILTSVINGPKRDHKLKIFSVSRQCRESKESDFFRNKFEAQLQLPLLYYCDDLEENDALCQQQAAV